MGVENLLQLHNDLNYFVCTLGQAAAINDQNPHSWDTVNDFIDHQARLYPERPAVGFPAPPSTPTSESDWDFTIYSMCFFAFEDLRQRSISTARRFRQYGVSADQNRAIALLCPSSIDFLFCWLALMRLGYSVLLIAPQCQPPAISHLCERCGVSTLVYDPTYHELAERTRHSRSPNSIFDLISLSDIVSEQKWEDLTTAKGRCTNSPPVEILPVSGSDVAYLHHTSGTSTGLPKPIPQTHHAAVGVLPSFDDGHDSATFTTTPLYHGGVADCFRAWTSGALIWLFPGRKVPITASNILKSFKCTRRATEKEGTPRVRYFSSVPFVIQMMGVESEGLTILKSMDLVGVGGAALPPNVGDDFVNQGVNLISRFGSAECGFLLSSHRQFSTDKAWQYLRSNKSPHLDFEPQDGGLAELIIRPSWPHMAKRDRDDGSYATADLFEPHRTIADAWRYHSRADSQLTLATGKKFDPAPVEAFIATSPLLDDVFIFGNGEQYPGALLFPSRESTQQSNDVLVHAIWPLIEKSNSESQSHTRLSRSMLVIMPKDAPALVKSSKGTTMRGPAEKSYAAEIVKAYAEEQDYAEGLTENGDDSVVIPDDSIPRTVLQIIKEVMNTQDRIPEDADLYSYGVDSVACMRIRALMQKKSVSSNAAKLPLNIVYDCGTIKGLSGYLLAMRKGGNFEREDETLQMKTYVNKYGNFADSKDIRSDIRSIGAKRTSGENVKEDKSKGDVIVLTGATGALGAHILAQLRSSSHVSEIHCLVRAASTNAAIQRVSKSLLARNKAPLDDALSSKVSCHPCKLSESSLGLSTVSTTLNGEDATLYKTLGSRTTIIIHAAWAVNFSMRLSSFEKDHIAGLHNLINFALASPLTPPPRFLFCSSTASVLGPDAKSPIPEAISHDPTSASPLGYSRSKWVAEAICEQAHMNTQLRDRISVLRIGQLCGDTEIGIWNVTEAWPLMLSSVKVTGSLPDLQSNLDWLPVDTAAEAVVQIAIPNTSTTNLKQQPSHIPIFHILNPNTQTKWSDLIHWLQHLSPGLRILPAADWVSELDELKGAAAKHPARKLLGLWKESYCREDSDTGQQKANFDLQQTKKSVSAMRDVQPIGETQLQKIWTWIEKEMGGAQIEDEQL